jgi:hypothetical protein
VTTGLPSGACGAARVGRVRGGRVRDGSATFASALLHKSSMGAMPEERGCSLRSSETKAVPAETGFTLKIPPSPEGGRTAHRTRRLEDHERSR